MKIDKEYEAMIAETTKRRTVKNPEKESVLRDIERSTRYLKPTPEVNKGNESAQTAWMRKLRRDLKEYKNGSVAYYIQRLIAWGNARKVRTAARPGGVGRR